VQRVATGPMIVALALFAVYTVYGATRAAITAEGYDPAVFWTSIAALYVIAAAAAWIAFRLYRIRQAKRRRPLTNA
jgi:small basic protein